MRIDRLQNARQPIGSTFADAEAIVADTSAKRRRPNCAAVAGSRAARYTRRHRIARLLWPLITAIIFLTLIAERRPSRTAPPSRCRHLATDTRIRMTLGQPPLKAMRSDTDSIVVDDGSGTVNGEAQPQHEPPTTLLAPNVVDVVMSLIRTRGRIDTEPVRMKWRMLDEANLALAVYLRDIEERKAWRELDAETQTVPEEHYARSARGKVRSLRHHKVFMLLPKWTARGEALMSSLDLNQGPDDPSLELALDAPDILRRSP